MLQDLQPHHQAHRLGLTASHLIVRPKPIGDLFPVDPNRKFKQLMLRIQRLMQNVFAYAILPLFHIGHPYPSLELKNSKSHKEYTRWPFIFKQNSLNFPA